MEGDFSLRFSLTHCPLRLCFLWVGGLNPCQEGLAYTRSHLSRRGVHEHQWSPPPPCPTLCCFSLSDSIWAMVSPVITASWQEDKGAVQADCWVVVLHNVKEGVGSGA